MKLNKKEISLIKEYIKKITSPKLENIGTGSEFNINKVWDFIESKPFHNKDYSPMFSTAREIYDKFGKKELEMYANFQWNGRNTPIHRKELANLQRIKTMDAASNIKKNY